MTMEIKSKIYGTPQYKSFRISHWKRHGIICDDFDMLYQEYIKTTKCHHCGKDFKSTKDRHLDHNHETGEVRKIVCQKCNILDSYIKYPDGYNRKLYEKEYRQTHKDSLKEKAKIYRKEHNDIINEKAKKYYKEHPEKLVKKRLNDSKPIECECGVVIRRDSMSKHIKRPNHFNPFLDYPKYNIFV